MVRIDPTTRLAQVLDRNRDALNMAIRHAQVRHPSFDGAGFLDCLAGTIAPLADAMLDRDAAAVEADVVALVTLGVDLYGRGIIGPSAKRTRAESVQNDDLRLDSIGCASAEPPGRFSLAGNRASVRSPAVDRLWREVLPANRRLLQLGAEAVVRTLTNATHNLASEADTGTDRFLATIDRAADRIDTLETLINAGAVAAWLAGLVRFRRVALDRLGQLPDDVARAVLDVGPDVQLDRLIWRLIDDPWTDLSMAASGRRPQDLEIVREVGGFIGLGGLFTEPPVVSRFDGRLVAEDGTGAWELSADRFGTHFQRIEAPNGRPDEPAGGLTLEADGTVRDADGSRRAIPILADCLSWASAGGTLAVSLPLSHSIFLVARGVGDPW